MLEPTGDVLERTGAASRPTGVVVETKAAVLAPKLDFLEPESVHLEANGRSMEHPTEFQQQSTRDPKGHKNEKTISKKKKPHLENSRIQYCACIETTIHSQKLCM